MSLKKRKKFLNDRKKLHLDEDLDLCHFVHDPALKLTLIVKRYKSGHVLKDGDLIPRTGYAFYDEKDLTGLLAFHDHKRLSTFLYKGTKCANPNCNCEGTRLVAGKDNSGGIHWDLYTESLVLMTVDHIVPQSNQGSWKLSNLQPLCSFCNNKKASMLNDDFLALNFNPVKRNRHVSKIA